MENLGNNLLKITFCKINTGFKINIVNTKKDHPSYYVIHAVHDVRAQCIPHGCKGT